MAEKKYIKVCEFHEGLAVVKGEDGQLGVIDESKTEVVPCIYDYVGNYKKGLAKVKKNDKRGIIDRKGNVLVSLKYDRDESYMFDDICKNPKRFAELETECFKNNEFVIDCVKLLSHIIDFMLLDAKTDEEVMAINSLVEMVPTKIATEKYNLENPKVEDGEKKDTSDPKLKEEIKKKKKELFGGIEL